MVQLGNPKTLGRQRPFTKGKIAAARGELGVKIRGSLIFA